MIKIKIIFSIILLALAVGCATMLPIPTQTDADRGASKFPNLTLEELNKGKSNADLYCKKCHEYYMPTAYSVEEWEKIIPKMAQIAKKKIGHGTDEIIAVETQESILKYIVTMREFEK